MLSFCVVVRSCFLLFGGRLLLLAVKGFMCVVDGDSLRVWLLFLATLVDVVLLRVVDTGVVLAVALAEVIFYCGCGFC